MRWWWLPLLLAIAANARKKRTRSPLPAAPTSQPATSPTVSAATDYYEANLYAQKAKFNYAVAAEETGYYQAVDLRNAQADQAMADFLNATAKKIVE